MMAGELGSSLPSMLTFALNSPVFVITHVRSYVPSPQSVTVDFVKLLIVMSNALVTCEPPSEHGLPIASDVNRFKVIGFPTSPCIEPGGRNVESAKAEPGSTVSKNGDPGSVAWFRSRT